MKISHLFLMLAFFILSNSAARAESCSLMTQNKHSFSLFSWGTDIIFNNHEIAPQTSLAGIIHECLAEGYAEMRSRGVNSGHVFYSNPEKHEDVSIDFTSEPHDSDIRAFHSPYCEVHSYNYSTVAKALGVFVNREWKTYNVRPETTLDECIEFAQKRMKERGVTRASINFVSFAEDISAYVTLNSGS